jgi:WD domain, G-beta repeat
MIAGRDPARTPLPMWRVSGRGLPVVSLVALLLVGSRGTAQPTASPSDADPRTLAGRAGEVFALAFSPDARHLASAGADTTISLWDTRTGKAVGLLRGHAGSVRTLVFARDGKSMVSGSDDRTIRVWDVVAGAEVRTIGGHFGAVTALALSPNQQVLVSGSVSGSLRVLDFRSGREVRAMKRGFATVHAAAFSPDGLTVVTGHGDGRISLWDVATARERGGLTGHTGPVLGVAVSPAEPLVASASGDRTVRLWDLGSGREVATLTGHQGDVTAVTFSADGALLASGGRDGTVRLWDVKRRQEHLSRADQPGTVWAVAMSADGTLLASAGQDQQIRLRSVAALLASPTASEVLLGSVRDAPSEVGPPPASPPLAVVAVKVSPAPALASADLKVVLSVTNTGKGPLYRFGARTSSPEAALDNLDFFFGKVGAGETVTVEQAVRLNPELPDSDLPIRLGFTEHNGFVPAPLETRVFVKGDPRPRFAYRYRIVDGGSAGSQGNGDGRLQRGEVVELLVTVKNVGLADARGARLEVWSPSLRGVRIRDASASFGTVAPDDARTARVPVEIARDFPGDHLSLMLTARETGVNARLTDEIKLAVGAGPGPRVAAIRKTVVPRTAGLLVHGGAGPDTPIVAVASGRQPLQVSAEAGDWYGTPLAAGELGWVPRDAVAEAPGEPSSAGPGPAGPGTLPSPIFQQAPPVVTLSAPADGLRTATAVVEVSGVASSARGIAGIEILVNGQPVVGGRSGARPLRTAGPSESLAFAQETPLVVGPNSITVTAVDRAHRAVRQTRTVYRTTQ